MSGLAVGAEVARVAVVSWSGASRARLSCAVWVVERVVVWPAGHQCAGQAVLALRGAGGDEVMVWDRDVGADELRWRGPLDACGAAWCRAAEAGAVGARLQLAVVGMLRDRAALLSARADEVERAGL